MQGNFDRHIRNFMLNKQDKIKITNLNSSKLASINLPDRKGLPLYPEEADIESLKE